MSIEDYVKIRKKTGTLRSLLNKIEKYENIFANKEIEVGPLEDVEQISGSLHDLKTEDNKAEQESVQEYRMITFSDGNLDRRMN